MTYGERLKKVRKNLNMTQSDFAKVLNIKNKQTISDVENGKQKKLMSDNELILLEKFGISPLYLAKGTNIDISQSVGDNSIVSDMPQKYGDKNESVSLTYYPEEYASAGGGAYPYLQESVPMSFSKNFLTVHLGLSDFKNIFILNTTGESMEPTLKNGSLIFVNPVENEGEVVRDGGIYVIMCGDAMVVKRVEVNPITKSYTLVSDHKEHESTTVENWEDSGCKFVGRVVGSFDRV